jgi:hypothetical protein
MGAASSSGRSFGTSAVLHLDAYCVFSVRRRQRLPVRGNVFPRYYMTPRLPSLSAVLAKQ